jgi:DNA-binding MarR family transcriptional regulator
MGKSVVALLELLDSPRGQDADMSAHLLGQVAAEVISGNTAPSMLEEIALKAMEHQIGDAAENASEPAAELRTAYALLVGLFQTLQVLREATASSSKGHITVKERILLALAQAPATPTMVAEQTGCARAVASRKLRELREDKLVERVAGDPADDARFHTHRLTLDGEAWVDRRFMGETAAPGDDAQPDVATATPIDADEQLATLILAARQLNRQDPAAASSLAPIVEKLAEEAGDPQLRADALGELCVLARSAQDNFDTDDMRRWRDALMDLADVSPSVTARAYYERGRWRMVHEPPAGNPEGALVDFRHARAAAANMSGDEKLHRLAWCSYQTSLIALHSGDDVMATSLATEAKAHFEEIADAQFNGRQGALACEILIARAEQRAGNSGAAKRRLELVLLMAQKSDYKRQFADAQRWLGQYEAEDGDSEAEANLTAAAEAYQHLANGEAAAMVRATKSSYAFLRSDMSDEYLAVLKKDLMRLSDVERGDQTPAGIWRKATLCRRLGVAISQTASDASEADGAFASALENYIRSRDTRAQSETLAWWWLLVHGPHGATAASLRGLADESGVEQLAEDVIASAVAVCGDLTMDAERGRRDDHTALVRHALLS